MRRKPLDQQTLLGLGFWAVLTRLDSIMATIQELLDDENLETTELAQLVTVVNGQTATIAQLNQTIADLQANAGQLTPEQQAQLDAVNAAQKANEATIQGLLPPAP